MGFNAEYRLMEVKSIAECSKSAILSTSIKLPVVNKTFVLYIFEWQFYTGFTEYHSINSFIKGLVNLQINFFIPLLVEKPIISNERNRMSKAPSKNSK